METVNNTTLRSTSKKLYEGMFLVDSALATSDWDGVNTTIKTVLDRAEAEIVSMQKWDERRLAYEIGGKNRGTYILCYFRADGGRIGDIERDVQLSERIVRVLILNADSMSQEDIEKDTPVMLAERRTSANSVESQPFDAAQGRPESSHRMVQGKPVEGREMIVGEGTAGKSETEPAVGGSAVLGTLRERLAAETVHPSQPPRGGEREDGGQNSEPVAGAEDTEPAAGGEDTGEQKPPE